MNGKHLALNTKTRHEKHVNLEFFVLASNELREVLARVNKVVLSCHALEPMKLCSKV